jgi:hypothetical protein
MKRDTSGRGHDAESPVRTTDVANRRIVVRPEQTTGATATAIDLGRQLASLTQALETLPSGRQSPAVVESVFSADAAARGDRPAHPALANTQLDRRATVSR